MKIRWAGGWSDPEGRKKDHRRTFDPVRRWPDDRWL